MNLFQRRARRTRRMRQGIGNYGTDFEPLDEIGTDAILQT